MKKIEAKIGNPLFDALPNILAFGPENAGIEVALATTEGWQGDSELVSKIDFLRSLAERKGRSSILLIDKKVAAQISREHYQMHLSET